MAKKQVLQLQRSFRPAVLFEVGGASRLGGKSGALKHCYIHISLSVYILSICFVLIL
jgi:hypothetical protein